MTDFGAAERFSLNRRGFLEFQCSLLGDGKTGATADNHQAFAIAQGFDGHAPVLLRGFAQAFGQGVVCLQQFAVFFPVRDQAGAGAEVAMKLFVAATLLSVPASNGRLNSHAASSGESAALTIETLSAPRLRNRRRLLTRSGL